MSKQFKINNYNCFRNNYKKRQQLQLWNQSSTSSSSLSSNHPPLSCSSQVLRDQIPRWPPWSLSRSSVCRSRWRKALGWCATRSTWSRGEWRTRRASSRCWRGSRARTRIGKCNVNLCNLSNLGDSPTLSTNSNRLCVIRLWAWPMETSSTRCSNSRWWAAATQLNNYTTRQVKDKIDGCSSKTHLRCFRLSTTINRSEMPALRARSRNRRPNSRSWQQFGQKCWSSRRRNNSKKLIVFVWKREMISTFFAF